MNAKHNHKNCLKIKKNIKTLKNIIAGISKKKKKKRLK